MKQAHGVTANNIGELSLVAQRKITTGAQVAMFAIGLTPVPPEE